MRPVAFYEMKPFVAAIIGNENRFFRGAAVDSRVCEPGQLFVALVGERTDGHRFVAELIEKGVTAFLVSSAYVEENRAQIEKWVESDDVTFLAAENPLAALQAGAKWYLEQMPQVQRVGVTGSNGKTTVKELTAAVLKRRYRVVCTQGNFNSEIGLPLVAFGVDPDDEIAVFEMGINHPGEMDILSQIVKPQTAILTNIFPAHVGQFENEEAIAREKMKIFSQAHESLTAFIGQKDRYFDLYRSTFPGNYVRFGMGVTDAVSVVENCGFGGWVLKIGDLEVKTALFGRHNLENICAAVALGRGFGLSDEEIVDGIASVESIGFARGCLKQGRVTLVEDCYNANPGSVAAAIELFRETAVNGRKIFVFGAMKELGVHSKRLHEEVGRLLVQAAFDRVLFYGEETTAAFEVYVAGGGKGAITTADFEALEKELTQETQAGDWVFLKGSRSLRLERLESILE